MSIKSTYARFARWFNYVMREDLEDLALKDLATELKTRRTCGGPNMNDKQYLEKMVELTEELDNVYSVVPFDPQAYRDVSARIVALSLCKNSKRRRRPWAALFCCLALLCVLMLIVYWILCVLWVRSTI